MWFFKGNGTVLCITALSYFPTAIAIAINLLEISMLQLPSNSSLADLTASDQHEHFSYALEFGDTRLPPTSMLMNTVEALATLALRDQTARSTATYFQWEHLPDVVIEVAPEYPATDVLNEVSLLCIRWAMTDVIRQKGYNNTSIDCYWDNVVVATARFQPPGYHPLSNTTSALAPTAESPGGSVSNSSLTNATNDTLLAAVVDPHFVFTPESRNIRISSVFATIFTVLSAFAFRPNTDVIPAYTIVRTGPEWDTCMLFDASTIRARPPYFEFRWAIETVRQMPVYLLQQRRMAELSIGINVDGVRVGNALLEKGELVNLEAKAGGAAIRL